MDYNSLMKKARKTNKRRNRAERKSGFESPTDGTDITLLRTAMSAIEAGIRYNNWPCVAEGQAMLEILADHLPDDEGEPGILMSDGIEPFDPEMAERMAKHFSDNLDHYINKE